VVSYCALAVAVAGSSPRPTVGRPGCVGSWGGPGRDVFVQALHGAAQSLTPVAGSCWFESSPRPPF
jgi:hypothetical protein